MISLPRLIIYGQIRFVNVVDTNILHFVIYVVALMRNLHEFDGSSLVVEVWMMHVIVTVIRVSGQMWDSETVTEHYRVRERITTARKQCYGSIVHLVFDFLVSPV